MRKFEAIFVATLACASTSATAQVTFERIILPACYERNFPRDAEILRKFTPAVDRAIEKYAALARNSKSLDKMFTRQGAFKSAARHRSWILDGVDGDPRTAKDPWIDASTRFERIGMVQSNDDFGLHVHWRVIAGDGRILGIYDAFMLVGMGGYHMRWLKLYSASAAVQPEPLKPFCLYPGDIEEREAKRVSK